MTMTMTMTMTMIIIKWRGDNSRETEGRAEKGFGTEDMESGTWTELVGETNLHEKGRHEP